MRTFLLITMLTTGLAAFAAEGVQIHEECAAGTQCRTLPSLDGPAESLAAAPTMSFDDANVTEVYVDSNQAQPQWTVRLNEEATRRFADLSRRNVGKKLFVVANDRVLLAPVVRQAIEGGSIAFSARIDMEKEIPWIWWKAASTFNVQGRQIEESNRRLGYLYFALAIPLLLGSLIYVLRAPKPSRPVADE